jgi:hypothetical protein
LVRHSHHVVDQMLNSQPITVGSHTNGKEESPRA